MGRVSAIFGKEYTGRPGLFMGIQGGSFVNTNSMDGKVQPE